ncbi:hypothetical protein [Curtobacterium sp. 24E2]|nr:hypothetical protein JN350_05550 [Curtobacterium sp. 24E2]
MAFWYSESCSAVNCCAAVAFWLIHEVSWSFFASVVGSTTVPCRSFAPLDVQNWSYPLSSETRSGLAESLGYVVAAWATRGVPSTSAVAATATVTPRTAVLRMCGGRPGTERRSSLGTDLESPRR